MASGDVKRAVLGNIHMYIRVIEVSDFKSDFKFLLLSSLPCIVARSSKGPLPSGLFIADHMVQNIVAIIARLMNSVIKYNLTVFLLYGTIGLGAYPTTQSQRQRGRKGCM